MCGILGIIGDSYVTERLLEGLRRLEYRGYDSAGIATFNKGQILRRRSVGKIRNLEQCLLKDPIDGKVGIGHTRWATHGGITEENAHPHTNGNVCLVHNGIIENHKELKEELSDYPFESQTDTETVVHLIQSYMKDYPPQEAIQRAIKRLKGHFSLVLFLKDLPDVLVAARQGSPLVIGMQDHEMFVGSDVLALSSFAQHFCYLENGDTAFLKRNQMTIFDINGSEVKREIKEISLPVYTKELGHYGHYMLKEIFEQPEVLKKTYNTLKDSIPFLDYDEIRIIACGTSFYAGMVAKYWFEGLSHLKTHVELASEFRYSKPLFHKNTCAIFISQSGETIDTLSCLQLLKEKGIYTLGIVNSLESSIARLVDHALYTEAGLEVGVASTKAFTAQLMVLILLAMKKANIKEDLSTLPLQEILSQDFHVPALFLSKARSVLFLGRGVSYPIALEGALKLKEISYIHAEGYAAGEMKHGPIALIDENVPVICIAPYDEWFEKTMSNMQEVLARKAQVLLITDKTGKHYAPTGVLTMIAPCSNVMISPFIYTVFVQMLAYYVALLKGTDIDQPRNLAKSVTVE